MVIAIGAYDTRACHAAIAARGAAAVIPPRKNGKPWKEHTAGAMTCNETLHSCHRLGRPSGNAGPASPMKPGQDKDALLQVAGRALHVTRLRQAGRRASNQGGDTEPIHSPRNPPHAARRIGLSWERELPAFRGFAQQSPCCHDCAVKSHLRALYSCQRLDKCLILELAFHTFDVYFYPLLHVFWCLQ